jgi:hypothetical protein
VSVLGVVIADLKSEIWNLLLFQLSPQLLDWPQSHSKILDNVSIIPRQLTGKLQVSAE